MADFHTREVSFPMASEAEPTRRREEARRRNREAQRRRRARLQERAAAPAGRPTPERERAWAETDVGYFWRGKK